MKYHIAFTLGRTQPPHRAHFKMLADALLSLEDNGKLIHFVGSTNIPLRFAHGEKNILSFEQRADMLKQGLIDVLREMYNREPQSIPTQFASRIQRNEPVLTEDNFVCLPAPDFSDPKAQFTSDEKAATVAVPFEGVRTHAVKQVADLGMAEVEHDQIKLANGKVVLSEAFGKTITVLVTQLHHDNAFHTDASEAVIRDISLFGPNYMGWAINIVRMLDEQVAAYSNRTGIKSPKVVYPCADKDKGTLQYILLTAAVIGFHPHDYDFALVLNDISTVSDAGPALNATDIRNAYVTLLNAPDLLAQFQQSPDLLLDTKQHPEFQILHHMTLHSRRVMLTAMMALKEIEDTIQPGPMNPSNTSCVKETQFFTRGEASSSTQQKSLAPEPPKK